MAQAAHTLNSSKPLGHGHSVKRHTGLMDWLTTVDHKKIAILYLWAGGLFFGIGGIEALLIRWQLIKPMNNFLDAQTFNELITMHGTTMIFLGVMPIIFALMNAVIPLQIGARDVAFPFLNALGFWTFLFGGILLNLSWIMGGAPDAGWTSYTPLSTSTYSTTHGVDFYTIGLQIAGLGTLIGGINFLATIITMRAPGMTYMRMPMFAWTTFITSAIILFAFPAVTVGLVLLTFDRILGANFFEVGAGGIRCSGNISSGYLVIQKYISSFCLPSELYRRLSRLFHGSDCSGIAQWCSLPS